MDEFVAWCQLKLYCWWYTLGLTKQQREENRIALENWERQRKDCS
ncbi:hypothetical protein EniyanLRS_133 [Mycobacterium phage EniyanLRS]|uniref:Uncharacterized protein n=1 Tax=Mycobacterium phage EniyanLRS TaxID=1933770 RepID=A0A2I2MPK4_9CAUD|nr:hypothetical protein EniyanLRS_133 [Mycobacterium phage EniyanLRS]